jgi:ankyrin repeat protein
VQTLNAQGRHGETALHWVAMNAILDRAKLLLDRGADPTIRDTAGNPEKTVQSKFQEMRNLLSEASRHHAEAATKSPQAGWI